MTIIFMTGIASWQDFDSISKMITDFKRSFNNLIIVSGDCKFGADKIIKNVCESEDIKHESKPTNYKLGLNAVHLRNFKAILAIKPEIIVFFGKENSYPHQKYMILKDQAKLMIHVTPDSKKYTLMNRLT